MLAMVYYGDCIIIIYWCWCYRKAARRRIVERQHKYSVLLLLLQHIPSAPCPPLL